MREPTKNQRDVADLLSRTYGRCVVSPTKFNHATGTVILTALTDDIERERWAVDPAGKVIAFLGLDRSNRSRVLQEYVEEWNIDPDGRGICSPAARPGSHSIWETA